jgi:mannose-6-phosphate isomerase-like protein (cupin superfamily)
MQSFFSLKEILTRRLASDSPYLEFLRVPAMSSGVYVLAPRATDTQTPHAEDEIYFVVGGSARMSVQQANGEALDREVAAGDLIFVPAQQEHRFHSVTAELVLLVIFARAESLPG